MKYKPNSFRRKLLSCFMFFTVVIFTVLWLLQTVFLQSFYNSMIIKNTVKAADKICSESGRSDIKPYIDEISRSNSILVFVTDTEGNIFYSSDEYKKGPKFRDDHNEPPERKFEPEKNFRYRELPENYKEFLNAINSSANGEAELRNDDIYVYGRMINFHGSDEKAVLYIGTTLNAVGSTARIIRIQLVWVTILSVIIGFVLVVVRDDYSGIIGACIVCTAMYYIFQK